MLTTRQMAAAGELPGRDQVDDAVTKPVIGPELLALLLRLVAGEPPTAPPRPVVARPLKPTARRPLKILLVEDNAVNQRLAARLLEAAGHVVALAGDGREALARLQAEEPDLVLMDVQMPVMDGLQAAAEIRARERGTQRHLPVVAMTAHAMSGDRERCLAAGMDGYVTKPIDARHLLETIDELAAARH